MLSKYIIALILIVVIAVAALIIYFTLVPVPGPLPAWNAGGTWTGSLSMVDIGPPNCTYSGTATLNLTQNGNNVTGTLNVTNFHIINQPNPNVACDQGKSPFQFKMHGVVNSTSISLIDNYSLNYTGSMTSSLMTLQVLRMPPPSSGGKQCVEYCGFKQTFKLTRQ